MKRCGPCYTYIGPNAFAAWEQDQVFMSGYGSEIKKECKVTLAYTQIPKHCWEGKARRRMKRYMKRQGAKG